MKDPVAHQCQAFSVPRWTLIPGNSSRSNEADVMEEASPGLPIDEKVQVARLIGFATGYRGEDTQIPRAVATGKAYDLRPLSGPQALKGHHGPILLLRPRSP